GDRAGHCTGAGAAVMPRRRGSARPRTGKGPPGAPMTVSQGGPDLAPGPEGSGSGLLAAVGLHLPAGDVGLGGALLRRVFLHHAVAVLVALQALVRAEQLVIGAGLLAGQLDRGLGRGLLALDRGPAGVAGDLAGLRALQLGLGIDVHAVLGRGLV